MGYLTVRFEVFYGPGAIIAVFHDCIIAMGIFALTGAEFSLQIVAALLALIGYSVHDTVIIYDRLREHYTKDKTLPLKDHVNDAVNQTLSRTILTSGATLFVCLAMYFLGGGAIKDFFFLMSVGIIVGTYSSIFIATPITVFVAKLLKKGQ
jgi:preprotein translocase subunit SecF